KRHICRVMRFPAKKSTPWHPEHTCSVTFSPASCDGNSCAASIPLGIVSCVASTNDDVASTSTKNRKNRCIACDLTVIERSVEEFATNSDGNALLEMSPGAPRVQHGASFDMPEVLAR